MSVSSPLKTDNSKSLESVKLSGSEKPQISSPLKTPNKPPKVPTKSRTPTLPFSFRPQRKKTSRSPSIDKSNLSSSSPSPRTMISKIKYSSEEIRKFMPEEDIECTFPYVFNEVEAQETIMQPAYRHNRKLSFGSRPGSRSNSFDLTRSTGPRMGVVNVRQKQAAELRKTDFSWSARQRDEKNDLTKQATREFMALLNKLSRERFSEVVDQMKKVVIPSVTLRHTILNSIVKKAAAEPAFRDLYADMIAQLNDYYTKKDNEGLPEYAQIVEGEDGHYRCYLDGCLLTEQYETREGCIAAITKNYLSMKRRLIFEVETLFHKREEEGKELDAQLHEAQGKPGNEAVISDLLEKQAIMRQRDRSNILFAGELYKKGVMAFIGVSGCVKKLLTAPVPDEDIACLCQLLIVIGATLSNEAKPKRVAFLHETIKNLSTFTNSGRVKFMIKDVIELKENGWNSKRLATKQVVTKTKAEVHQEQRKLEEQKRRTRGSFNETKSMQAPRKRQAMVAAAVSNSGFGNFVGFGAPATTSPAGHSYEPISNTVQNKLVTEVGYFKDDHQNRKALSECIDGLYDVYSHLSSNGQKASAEKEISNALLENVFKNARLAEPLAGLMNALFTKKMLSWAAFSDAFVESEYATYLEDNRRLPCIVGSLLARVIDWNSLNDSDITSVSKMFIGLNELMCPDPELETKTAAEMAEEQTIAILTEMIKIQKEKNATMNKSNTKSLALFLDRVVSRGKFSSAKVNSVC
eukprot:TRINITY_DN12745_c0_g1_i1.p1 TRINITY_DN12745_c0_g1~~TRINITY_DN12745_c0_g1_i1.p1  ORF type:complete len:798 (-),score=254.01 TRINITY_DN12745_c0_g1_i1:764-3007(-)